MPRFFTRSAALLLSGLFCGASVRAEGKADLVRADYAEERVVDLSIVKKVTGQKKILFIKTPQYTEYLEGFIRGMIVDYADNPVEGVLVRVGDPGEENSMFDPTVTNFNGIYRIRFSIPFDKKSRVNIKNKVVYAPDWEQKRDSLGNSYEPLEKETPFHLVYDRSLKLLAFSEGLRKGFVNPVQRGETSSPTKKEPGSTKKAKSAAPAKMRAAATTFSKPLAAASSLRELSQLQLSRI